MMRTVFIFLWVLSLHVWGENLVLKDLFERYNLQGTMVIQSLNESKEFVYNEQRATTPLLPASTFKILNTLIALNENIIDNETSVILWDKKDKGMPQWNQDQTLKTAFQYSCVWCYQEFAQKIGLVKYQHYLKQLHYGNEQISHNVTTFWLKGELKITAKEQISFLKKLYSNDLPFKRVHLDTLKSIMIEEENELYTLRAKTGWATSEKPNHGWYVGYIQMPNDVWFFATNIITKSALDLPLRKKITLEALNLLQSSKL